MIVDTSWTFKEIVKKAKTVKLQYEEVLSSFSNFELKENNIFKKELRDTIYSLNIDGYKKDRFWEYINDCLEYKVLKQIYERECYGRIKRKNKNINK